ncbi:ABC transporter ATP-binding protein [Dialister pneumosintes]|uniref:Iron ABC transporter ATP-binding protein n=1 Tax=Dialister pneumosintes TaxID=39950 RepID=A0A1B3WF28_9FIRM|nr:ABC transporter ATP-binding protein [Dialister pneumosintes]AOH39560.1 iron ABC transporter ATP-binding protein [Dialister pneumosintes]MBS6480544.1 ABC transporter ATP-binding protein [Dialister sp.]
MSILETKQISIGYGTKKVLEHISLRFDIPEIVSIIGPNGSGKSTLVKALAGILPVLEGEVLFQNKEIHSISERIKSQQISYLPQIVEAPPDMLVKELVMYGRMPYQSLFSEADDKDRELVAWALQETALQQLKNRRIGSLSGGEKQRAWIAMALAKQPKVLILDEPTTYLDIKHQMSLMELVTSLYQKMNILILMVMHDLNYAARYGHRLIALKNGQIMADSTCEEVFCPEVLEPLYGIQVKILKENIGQKDHLLCVPCNIK